MLLRRYLGGIPVVLGVASVLAGAAFAAADVTEAPAAVLRTGVPRGATDVSAPAPEPISATRASAIAEDPFWNDDEGVEDSAAERDPLEGGNRAVFKFNQAFDGIFWRPLTKGYQFVVPDVARVGVRRFFKNLNSPSTMMNDLFQGRPLDAGKTLGRFVLNTTLGFGGFFDAARQAGEAWEGHESDFGQTLALAGVGSGPYLMIPLLGPNTLRDGVGGIVDLAMQPLSYFLLPVQLVFAGGAWGLAVREEHAARLEALRESSLDYYATLRSAYFQNRDAQIRGTDLP